MDALILPTDASVRDKRGVNVFVAWLVTLSVISLILVTFYMKNTQFQKNLVFNA